MLGHEGDRAKVVVLLTDGQDVSSHTSLADAVAGARKAGVLVYPIAIGASIKTQKPLQEIAAETGGAFHGAATSASLKGVYSSIAAELRRTWRLEYVTAARPGEKLHLRVSLDPEGAASTDVQVPGDLQAPSSSDQFPAPFYSPLGGLVMVFLVGFIVLTVAGGLGIPLYGVFWIVLPTAQDEAGSSRMPTWLAYVLGALVAIAAVIGVGT